MQRIPPELTANARTLRRSATEPERRLWLALRQVRPRFTRKLVVSHFILDFACRQLRLAVEIDGGHHAEQREADGRRTAYLEANGWTVLRFWNSDIGDNLPGVLATIIGTVDARAATHPRPLPSREGRRSAS